MNLHFIRVHSFIFLFIWLWFVSANTKGQTIENADAILDKLNRQIIITYDLFYTQSKYDKFEVRVFLSTDGGKTFKKDPLEYVNGSIGKGITPGYQKQIFWRYLNEDPAYTGANTSFKVEANLDFIAHEERISKLKGGKAALNSMVFPGWGDNKVRSGKNYWWIGAVSYGLLGTGVILHIESRNKYDAYKKSTSIPEVDANFKDATNLNKLSTYFLAAGAAIWLTDVVWVFIKGNQNNREKRNIQNWKLNQKTGWQIRPGYDPYQGNASLKLHHKF